MKVFATGKAADAALGLSGASGERSDLIHYASDASIGAKIGPSLLSFLR